MEAQEFVVLNKEDLIEITDFNYPLDESSFPNRKTKYAQSNIVNYMFQRQSGDFDSSLKLKTKQLTPKYFYYCTGTDIPVNECHYIKPGLDGKSVIGMWQGMGNFALVYRLQLHLNLTCSSRRDDSVRTLVGLERQGPYCIQSSIADISDTYLNSSNCILYGGRKCGILPYLSPTVICTFKVGPSTELWQYVIPDRDVLCCCGCPIDNIFAVGTSQGMIVCKNEGEVYSLEDKLLDPIGAMEFSSDANSIYCGCNSPNLIVNDLRAFQLIKMPINGLSPIGISSMKLMSNGNQLIASCRRDNFLGKIDLRQRGVIQTYPSPVRHTSTSLTVSESADLICATGCDNVTRIWSCSTSELLHSIEPRIPLARTHSAIVSSGVRWAVAIFQKDKMFVLEPWT